MPQNTTPHDADDTQPNQPHTPTRRRAYTALTAATIALLLAAMITFAAPATAAQTTSVTLNGTITDADTGEVIVGATVETASGQNVTTDTNGQYTLSVENQTTVDLTITAPDYETETASVFVEANTTRDYALVPVTTDSTNSSDTNDTTIGGDSVTTGTTDTDTIITEWTQGSWLQAILLPFTSLLGESLVATTLGGSLILSFWIYSGDIVLPSIILLILGGVLLTFLSGSMIGFARAFIVLALAGGLMALARRYIL